MHPRRTAPGVLDKFEHLEKLHPSQPAASAAATGGSGEGGGVGGGAAEGQPGGAAVGPEAGSEMLKTDSPGVGETQHPGETTAALVKEKVGQGRGKGLASFVMGHVTQAKQLRSACRAVVMGRGWEGAGSARLSVPCRTPPRPATHGRRCAARAAAAAE